MAHKASTSFYQGYIALYEKWQRAGESMGILLWYPVLVPQISGGLKPLIPVTANLSLHVPIGVVTANPDIVAKSSLQTSMIVGGSNLRQIEKKST